MRRICFLLITVLFLGVHINFGTEESLIFAKEKEQKIYFTDTTDKLYIWDSYRFTAETRNLDEKAVLRYSVSDWTVASIGRRNGILKAKKTGSVTVTVTDKTSGITASCDVDIIKGSVEPINEITVNRYTKIRGVYYRSELVSGGAVIDEASISLTGDIMCLRAQQNAAKKNGKYNFNEGYKYIKKLFERTDYAIGNLETLVSYSNPITSVQNTVNGAPNCNAPGTILDAVRYAGFCSVVTANNHCCDGDVTGILETLEVLDRYDVPHVGTYRNRKSPRYIIVNINNIKVAFLSYTELINQRGSLNEEEHQKHVGRYDIDAVKEDITTVKAAGAEFIIAYNHWGTENTHTVNSRQKTDAAEMADAGVDLIIGSHPHCLQPAEYIKASDGRKVLCVYSMGNLVSSMASTINNDTVILEITLKRNTKTGKVKLKSAGYIPCRVYSSYKNIPHVIIPTSDKLNGGITNSTLSGAAVRIRKVMGEAINEIKK